MVYKVYFEEYHNEHDRRDRSATFPSLRELEEWIFDVAYSHKHTCFNYNNLCRIDIDVVPGDTTFWIYMIESPKGIELSDGRRTDHIPHISKEMKEWCERCEERKKTQKFNFVD